MKLGGVIYLHNIAERRMEGANRRNLEMFRKLCGKDALPRVVLVTTSWAEVTPEVGQRREKELAHIFWKEMMSSGSQMCRFTNTQDSARAILNLILRKVEKRPPERGTTIIGDDKHDTLKIQKELVDLQRFIPETDAGKELRYTLQEAFKLQKDMAEGDHEEEAALALKQEKVLRQIKDLHIPLSRRILGFLRLVVSSSQVPVLCLNITSVMTSEPMYGLLAPVWLLDLT